MKNKKGSHISDARPSFTTHDLLSSDLFDSDMEEEVKLYDKEEEKDVMMKRWSAKELKEGIELKINLPGFGKDDIKVTVDGTSLVITTLLGKEEEDVVSVGPDVNEDDMNTVIIFDLDFDDLLNLEELKAEMKNRLLKITIPKVKVEEKNVILVTVE
ncbi:heat shock 22 kDa protein, mitochondrial-like [Papaver somniferum]|uniref:heat shock 22 kDa protein, mitochondrial-like n=1 Tax=Papaver somniferum TaxID=3469 RepID=UPI000E6FDAC4|nr:heat shock 22 kDa protein, mitochondrial-like [Papaver somniferum]